VVISSGVIAVGDGGVDDDDDDEPVATDYDDGDVKSLICGNAMRRICGVGGVDLWWCDAADMRRRQS
jgi:hypothetical protein